MFNDQARHREQLKVCVLNVRKLKDKRRTLGLFCSY
jgi:hypothetical protein